MTDAEKAIYELLYMKHDVIAGSDKDKALDKAIAVLKEQEPVKPKQRNPHLGAWWYECGNCDTAISPSDKYCRGCGRVIDWNL